MLPGWSGLMQLQIVVMVEPPIPITAEGETGVPPDVTVQTGGGGGIELTHQLDVVVKAASLHPLLPMQSVLIR